MRERKRVSERKREVGVRKTEREEDVQVIERTGRERENEAIKRESERRSNGCREDEMVLELKGESIC